MSWETGNLTRRPSLARLRPSVPATWAREPRAESHVEFIASAIPNPFYLPPGTLPSPAYSLQALNSENRRITHSFPKLFLGSPSHFKMDHLFRSGNGVVLGHWYLHFAWIARGGDPVSRVLFLPSEILVFPRTSDNVSVCIWRGSHQKFHVFNC